MVATQEIRGAPGDGAASLADVVLSEPEHGNGYFYPATATGVPLAVACFGFSVLTLSLANAEIIPPEAGGIFVPVALATGGLGMLVGGLAEFRTGNMFGATFGVIYACFLITTGLLLQFFAPGITEAAGAEGFGDAFGAYLLLWAAFTAMLTVGTRYVNLPAFIAFALLVVVYVVLGINSIVQPESTTLAKVGGWLGILDGLAAWYLASGIVLNDVIGRDVIPLFPYTPRS
jgi:succinate-acetate transporter protein